LNWLAWSVLAYVVLGLELALTPALRLGEPGGGAFAPMLTFVLAVYAAQYAAPLAAMAWGMTLGLLIDLTARYATGSVGSFVIVGPHALGFLAGVYFIVIIRPMLMRNSAVALAVVCVVAAAIAQIVCVTLLKVHAWVSADFDAFSATSELWRRLACALYTGPAALVMALMLRPLGGVLGASETMSRRSARMGAR
jgi:hypothetical protein